jgi:hypothetical protein
MASPAQVKARGADPRNVSSGRANEVNGLAAGPVSRYVGQSKKALHPRDVCTTLVCFELIFFTGDANCQGVLPKEP